MNFACVDLEGKNRLNGWPKEEGYKRHLEQCFGLL